MLIMLEISLIMLALCFMISSPYYAKNYVGIIDSSLISISSPNNPVSFFNFCCVSDNDVHNPYAW